jgi:predicted AlkP superfamily pyrophosphatase or phosphodiesterase
VHKTVVLNVVGLTPSLLPNLPSLRGLGSPVSIGHVTPAVTCNVQATYLTGTLPKEHGIVGNGWYFREQSEVKFWNQSDKLVNRPRIWEIAKKRNPTFTCANLFWWNAMYSSADITVTPRPMYPADGRKIPDLWTNPPELRQKLQAKLGQFPLFKFWGPATSIESSQWIANATVEIDRQFNPTLTLIYLPHLDYGLQKWGSKDPRIKTNLIELDTVVSGLLSHYLNQKELRLIVLSEYGIEPVDRPIHINRILRGQNLITVREELGRELLDAGASPAFAVADHQVAHVYVNDPDRLESVRQLLQCNADIADVLDRTAQREIGLDHPRSGDLFVIAKAGAWFTYYYWLDDSRAPDFARTVDIHRKPGYDPVELFLDPKLSVPQLHVGWKLLRRKLGLRGLLDVIPLDASLVRGSHGRAPSGPSAGPVLIANDPKISAALPATGVCNFILEQMFG